MENFQFIPVLSRENSNQWKGEKGYVHEVYKKNYSAKPPAQFYICGWKVMILEAVGNLKKIGYLKEDIRYELYD